MFDGSAAGGWLLHLAFSSLPPWPQHLTVDPNAALQVDPYRRCCRRWPGACPNLSKSFSEFTGFLEGDLRPTALQVQAFTQDPAWGCHWPGACPAAHPLGRAAAADRHLGGLCVPAAAEEPVDRWRQAVLAGVCSTGERLSLLLLEELAVCSSGHLQRCRWVFVYRSLLLHLADASSTALAGSVPLEVLPCCQHWKGSAGSFLAGCFALWLAVLP